MAKKRDPGVRGKNKEPFMTRKMKDAAKSELIAHDTLLATNDVVCTVLHSIIYVRNLFPKDFFTDHSVPVLEMNIKQLLSKSNESEAILNWLENGVYDALKEKYLKSLTFSIYQHDGSVNEEYEFSFSYSTSGGIDIDIGLSTMGNRKSTTTFKSSADISPTQMRSSAAGLAINLASFMKNLDTMPDEVCVQLRMIYRDDITPEDYKPPFYQCGAQYEVRNIWTNNSANKQCVLSLKVKSVSNPPDGHTKMSMDSELDEDAFTSNADSIDVEHDDYAEKGVLTEIYPKVVKRVLYAGIYTPRNIFRWSLNGSPQDVQRGYQNLYNHIHSYLRTRGHAVDVSNLFGKNKEVYTTPEDGTFHVILEHESEEIDFVIEARYWWLRGFESENGKFEIPDMKTGLYMVHPDCKKLRFKGNYYPLCNGKPGSVVLGLPRIIKGFHAIKGYRHDMKEPEEFRIFMALFTLLLCEGPRLLPAFEILSRSIVDSTVTKLEEECEWIDILIHNWKSSCTFIMSYLQSMYEGRSPEIPSTKIPGMNSKFRGCYVCILFFSWMHMKRESSFAMAQ